MPARGQRLAVKIGLPPETASGMNIGEAAVRSGVTAKMIRHYEELGLIKKAHRTASGYRTYGDSDVHTLRFIRHARDMGFSIRQIADLLSLWQNRRRRSSEVKALALAHIEELDQRMVETQAMKATLEHLAHCCHGDERPDCPIIDMLADATLRAPARSAGGGAIPASRQRGLRRSSGKPKLASGTREPGKESRRT
jgi:MerR family copper efflux transcriptional regulator